MEESVRVEHGAGERGFRVWAGDLLERRSYTKPWGLKRKRRIEFFLLLFLTF